MRLFLIRHGETPWTVEGRYQGTTDVPLNARGLGQAKDVARALRPEQINFLYTSPLRRARETAHELTRPLRLKPAVDPRLAELNFGKWEGANFRQLAERNGSLFRKWRQGKLRRPPGGESVDSLARRTNGFLKELIHRFEDQTVAVVCHGGPIKMFLFRILKAGSASILSFRIDSGSISLIEGNRDLLQIQYINQTRHLRNR